VVARLDRRWWGVELRLGFRERDFELSSEQEQRKPKARTVPVSPIPTALLTEIPCWEVSAISSASVRRKKPVSAIGAAWSDPICQGVFGRRALCAGKFAHQSVPCSALAPAKTVRPAAYLHLEGRIYRRHCSCAAGDTRDSGSVPARSANPAYLPGRGEVPRCERVI
jgi:hypothetical protein